MALSRPVSRRIALKVGAGAAALALPSVARGERAAVLKFIPLADLVSLDPIWTTATVTRSHGFMVFDTLYGQAGAEQGFVATPQMVAGHTVESEGKIWKLTLRDGLFFHDGTKVLARDCVASIRRWGVRDGFGQVLMQRTDELSAPDDRTIVFRLKKPFGLLPDALGKFASNMCAIMPERLASTDPFTQITDATGSGPFKFMADERVQGSLFAYERFKNYRPRNGGSVNFASGPKIAHFDRVEWHVIPDPATAAAALQSGEVDWWELTIPDLLPPLRRGGKVTIQRYGSLGVCSLLRPNHLFPPFDNAAVRRALIGAIDQTELMTAMMGSDPSLRRVPAGFFAPGSPLASDVGLTALTGPRNYMKVRKDLDVAGYRGEKITLMVATDNPRPKPLSDVVADTLQKAGMNVDYQAMDFGTMVQRRASKRPPEQGGWNAFCTGSQGLDFLSPATHQPLRCNGAQAWFGWPTSPEIERLHDQWFDTPDLAGQKKICAEIQAQAFIDVPYYPLGFYYPDTAFRSDLVGVLDGFPIFWNVRRTA